MAEEFIINSTAIESKINQLLPTQGGFQPGVDFSASTMVIPIVDLTETAEGSTVREDLQTSFSHTTTTNFNVNNTTTNILTTTGYFRIFGNCHLTGAGTVTFRINDGATNKSILTINSSTATTGNPMYDFTIFLKAGDTFTIVSNATAVTAVGIARQIADLDGNLTDP